METLIQIFNISSIIPLVYLFLSGVYFLVFAVASLFYKEKPSTTQNNTKYKVAILIPAYKEDSVIVETTLAAIKHKSKLTDFDVVVIADSLLKTTLNKLKQLPTHIVNVTFKNSTKSKAIRFALQQLNSKYDYAIILDADNVMAPNFIDHLLIPAQNGLKIIQGQRTAKNNNTSLAILDGLSEAINNSIFRTGHRVLGLSASLIGSGFAIEYSLLKYLINQSKSIGGFDKELEIMLLKRGTTIGYSKNAIVYDEKVQKSNDFVNQRRRWLAAQWKYLIQIGQSGFIELIKKGNLDYFDKQLQFIVPPRIIALGFSIIMSVLFAVFDQLYDFNSLGIVWLFTFLINLSAILLSIPKKFYKFGILSSVLEVPKGFMLTIVALSKIKNANKQFIHTSHGIKK